MGKGTITKARSKLKPAAFRELLHKTVKFTYRNGTGLERPGGMRILAVDGSRLSLPESPAIRKRFSPRARANAKTSVKRGIFRLYGGGDCLEQL